MRKIGESTEKNESVSDNKYMDKLNILYCRWLERANGIEIKQRTKIWMQACCESPDTLGTSACAASLSEMILKHNLKQPLLKGAALAKEVQRQVDGPVQGVLA